MRSAPAKPLLGLLLATLVFFALWFVALKPSSSTSGGQPNGLGQYQSAINKAHQAVATSNAANAKLGAPVATTSGPKSPTPTTTTPAAKTAPKVVPATKPATKPLAKASPAAKTAAKAAPAKAAPATKPAVAPSTAAQVKLIANAIAAHDVVAVLFYNPAAADDQALKRELGAVPTQHGQVVKLAVPVSELTQFQGITAQVPVVTAPTLILIDPSRQATVLTGYASQLEINQRVADALAAK
jgi:hypothetical protein